MKNSVKREALINLSNSKASESWSFDYDNIRKLLDQSFELTIRGEGGRQMWIRKDDERFEIYFSIHEDLKLKISDRMRFREEVTDPGIKIIKDTVGKSKIKSKEIVLVRSKEHFERFELHESQNGFLSKKRFIPCSEMSRIIEVCPSLKKDGTLFVRVTKEYKKGKGAKN